jgi:hypothetical protein
MAPSESPWHPWKKWFGWGWGRFSFLNAYRLRRTLEDHRQKDGCKPEKSKEKPVHVFTTPVEKKDDTSR